VPGKTVDATTGVTPSVRPGGHRGGRAFVLFTQCSTTYRNMRQVRQQGGQALRVPRRHCCRDHALMTARVPFERLRPVDERDHRVADDEQQEPRSELFERNQRPALDVMRIEPGEEFQAGETTQVRA
jgi:hypothetical protein